MMRFLLAWMLACGTAAAGAAEIDVRDFFRHSEVNDIELSPTGEYLAVTVPQDDRTLLAVLRTADKGIVAKWDYGAGMHVIDVVWVNDERFVVRVAEKRGSFDYLVQDAHVYAANADGSKRMQLTVGNTYEIVDLLEDDPRYILMQRTVERPNLFKVDVYTGRMTKVAVSPVESGGSDAELRAQSPAYNAEKIGVPVMLVHGRKDRRVPIEQMEFLIDRMKKAGKASEHMVIEDKEGHGFYDLDNNAELYSKMLAFFEKYIGAKEEAR